MFLNTKGLTAYMLKEHNLSLRTTTQDSQLQVKCWALREKNSVGIFGQKEHMRNTQEIKLDYHQTDSNLSYQEKNYLV